MSEYCIGYNDLGLCVLCGYCIDVCPAMCIVENDEHILIWHPHCECCEGCIDVCPADVLCSNQ